MTVNGSQVSCLLTQSAAVKLAAWLNPLLSGGTISNATPLRLTGWGGTGGDDGANAGGAGGSASLATSVSALVTQAGQDGTLYAYVGSGGHGGSCTRNLCGGAATIVMIGMAIGAIDDSQLNTSSVDPATQNVVLMAGGGGSSGIGHGNGAGGAGGACASSPSGECNGAGGHASGGPGCGGAGGDGGVGGAGGAAGDDGIGGLGGGGAPWTKGPSITIPRSWTSGNGGSSDGNGAGGGGWGGGGGNSANCAGPGGGGGSWAAQSTVASPYPAAATSSPAGRDGAFEIYFETLVPIAPTVTQTPSPKPTRTPATRTRTITLTPAPPHTPTPTPVCDSTSDSCTGMHTQLFAIAHSFNDPQSTILYRVTVPAWSTGTNWGDGTNGFFYQAEVGVIGTPTPTPTGGGVPTPTATHSFVYVPFNGIAVDANQQPQLPQFSFIVPVDVSAGPDNTTLTITACASNYQGPEGATPPCTTPLWTDTFDVLPLPVAVEQPFTDDDNSVTLTWYSQDTLSLPNTGVYTDQLLLEADWASTPSADDQQWLANHLVFFDACANPFTNDLFDTDLFGSDAQRSLGVLTLDEATYTQDGVNYQSKYGPPGTHTRATSPLTQYYFYTFDQTSNAGISAGVQFIYDQPGCPGFINDMGSRVCSSLPPASGVGSCSPVSVAPYATISPVLFEQGNSPTLTANTVEAGTQEIRTLYFTAAGGALCGQAMNPLAVNVRGSAAAYNPANYLISETSKGSTGLWDTRFPNGLYYVVSSGFGNCINPNAEPAVDNPPFCERTADYAAYTAQYQDTSGQGGALNGNSTAAKVVGSLTLADYYQLTSLTEAAANSLVWFDNCGYGWVYEECSGCPQKLGTRQGLPSPPNNASTYEYQVTNTLEFPVSFNQECCASFYQPNPSTCTQDCTWIPPLQIDNSNGVFIAPGETVAFQTLFSDTAMPVYNASTGDLLFKLRLNASGNSAVYGCGMPWSATVSDAGTATFDVTLGAGTSQSLHCEPVGDCPFGTVESQDGQTVTCTATSSSFLLGMSEWASEVGFVTNAVRLQAWGSAGAAGCCAGGDGGSAGFALTTIEPADLGGKDLYAYIAQGESGSSTVLTSTELSALTSAAAQSSTDPSSVGVLLIAPGGGEGGDGTYADGANGGGGGVANANSSMLPGAAVSAPGSNGDNAPEDGGDGGKGGNQNGDGTAGNQNAGAGIGGWGRNTNWNSGSLIPPQSWSAGNGATTGNTGGDGGAGYGGGAGGGGAPPQQGFGENGGGGGGGGAWAAGNTAYDPTAPTSAPGSPNGDSGAVQLVYTKGAVPCVKIATSSSAVRCTYATSMLPLNTSALGNQILQYLGTTDETIPVYFEAWGGSGGAGGNSQYPNGGHGGAAGRHGYASSLYTIADLITLGQAYLYIGGNGAHGTNSNGGTTSTPGSGGASTIVIAQPLENVGANNTSTDPRGQGVWLLAGGGGGGGQSLSANVIESGGDGGQGGVAMAGTSADANDKGRDGRKGTISAKGGSSGVGGCTLNIGSSNCGGNGIGGFGGNSSGSTAIWLDADLTSWSAGTGGGASSGGGGGGGFGGGEAGPTANPGMSGAGGAGGGSWALQATATDSNPLFLGPANPPAPDGGAVVLTFDPCAVEPSLAFCR